MKYTDHYKFLMIEAFGDVERIKWKQQVPTLSDTIINDYIAKFQDIRVNKYRSTQNDIENFNIPKGNDRFDISKYGNWSDFETFIDYVSGQVDLENTKGQKLKDVDLTNYKPLVDEHGLQIYYADTPRACIEYKGDMPYSWCVSRKSTNLYYAYRYRSNQPSFYFVKDVAATQKELSNPFTGSFKNEWHFFVVQKTKHQTYIVTSANNNGDVEMTWNEILRIQPKLNGMEHYFKHVPLKRKEVLIYKKFKDLNDAEFIKLKYSDKSLYLDMFPSDISDEKFKYLPDDLKNKYIGFGLGLTENQYDQIKNNKNLLKRHIQMAERRIELCFEQDRFSNLTDGDMCVFFDTVEGQKILDEYLLKDINSHTDLLKITIYRSDKLKRDTDKLIEHILYLKPTFKAFEIRHMLYHSSNPASVVTFLETTKKGGFQWINEMNDTMYELILTEPKNFNALLDTLLKLNKKQRKIGDAADILSAKNTTAILLKSADYQSTFDIFKENGFTINIDEYNIDKLLYSNYRYENALALIRNLGNQYDDRNITIFLSLLDSKPMTVDQRQTLVEAIISTKTKFNDDSFRGLISFSPFKEKTFLLIHSNHKYAGNFVGDFMYLLNPRITELKNDAPYILVSLICKYGKNLITDIQRILLLASLPNVVDVIRLMKKYDIEIPKFSDTNIKWLLSDSHSPLKLAEYLHANNIPFTIKKTDQPSLFLYSMNPVEVISAFQLLNIPIILSDSVIFQILNKHKTKGNIKLLVSKFVEIYGKQRLLNLRRLTFQLKNIIDDTNTDKSA